MGEIRNVDVLSDKFYVFMICDGVKSLI